MPREMTGREKIVSAIAVSTPVIILILLLTGFFTGFLLPKETIQDKLNISMTIIGNECESCQNMSAVLERLPFAIEAREITMGDGEKLIEKYNLRKFPVVVAEGNEEALTRMGFRQKGKVWVFDNVVPYYDTKDDTVHGLLQMTFISHTACRDCESSSTYIEGFKDILAFDKITNLNQTEAKDFIEEYKITRFPVIFLEGNVQLYSFYDTLLNIGRKRGEYLILEDLKPPYYSTITNQTKGLVDITYINCEGCNNSQAIYEPLITDISIRNKTVLNETEAEDIIEMYNITVLPTMIISSEIHEHSGFADTWYNVGTIEKDGSLVYRLENDNTQSQSNYT